jgi:hypothetical protein
METTTQKTTYSFTDAEGKKFNLLKEWDFKEFDRIKYQLILGFANYLESRDIEINRRDIDETFGFAYTSSGVYAGLWACNGYKLAHNKDFNSFEGIVIDEELQSYLMFDNAEEKSILIPFVRFAHSEQERVIFETNELNRHTEAAYKNVLEYLKQFEGKKILTNSGLSKKLDIPTFSVREKTKYGFYSFDMWIESNFERTMFLKTKACLNGGAYMEDNFRVSTQFCTYLNEFKYIGDIDKMGIYTTRKEKESVLPQFDAETVRFNICKLKEKQEQIKQTQNEINEIKKDIPATLYDSIK